MKTLYGYILIIAGHFGRHFVLSFSVVSGNASKTQINIVSLVQTDVTILSPISGVNRTVHVNSSSGLSIDLPSTLIKRKQSGNNYIKLESSSSISVTALTLVQGYTADGYLSIPSSRLGMLYYFVNNRESVLSFMALNDNTHITVTVTAGLYLISPNGTNVKSLSIKLSSLDGYQIKCSDWCCGYVNSSSPISFRYGSYNSYSDTDFLYTTSNTEEAVQVNTSPLAFIVPVFSTSQQGVLCVSSSNMTIQTDNTDAYRQGAYTFIAKFTSAKYVMTNQSASCTYYGHGFSVIIPPISSYINSYRFLTPSLPNFTHHAAIMVLTANKRGIRLDSSSPTARQETVSIESQSYSVLYINLTYGQHDITHVKPSINFGVVLYGFMVDGNGSYAYPAGMRLN